MHFVGQHFPSLAWRVVDVDDAQGRGMKERNVPHVYDTPAQAHAVCDRLNKTRGGRDAEVRNRQAV